MYQVTPPSGVPLDRQELTLDQALWSLSYHMGIHWEAWEAALDNELRGEIRFSFVYGGAVGTIEAIIN